MAVDHLLDQARTGPTYLKQPEIATIILDVLAYTQKTLLRCTIHAFVIMPNHVHLLATPNVPLSQLTKTIKNYSARQANKILTQTGKPFWQDETYDHLVRTTAEAQKIQNYIENNPVKAGLAKHPNEYQWSSANFPNGL